MCPESKSHCFQKFGEDRSKKWQHFFKMQDRDRRHIELWLLRCSEVTIVYTHIGDDWSNSKCIVA